MTKLPGYFNSILNISIETNGLFNSLVYVGHCTSLLAGPSISNLVKKRSKLSLTAIRKIFQCLGNEKFLKFLTKNSLLAMSGPVVCLFIIPFLGYNKTWIVVLSIASMTIYGLITAGEYPIISEFAQDFSGTTFGVANTFSSFGGFMAPNIIGWILESNVFINFS